MMKQLLMKKKVYLIAICLMVAAVALVTVISTQVASGEKDEELERLRAQKEALIAENEKYEHDLSLDVTDEYIIRIMRKLGYYFPGEEQIVAEDQDEE
ncbi:MAG: hypothetical protein IKM34_07545 [Clostridia bacterium]|nr:hypothetical protein [Clostridia bacterium]